MDITVYMTNSRYMHDNTGGSIAYSCGELGQKLLIQWALLC